MRIALSDKGTRAEHMLRPSPLLLKAATLAVALLAFVSYADEPKKVPPPKFTEGGYSGPKGQGKPVDITRWAEDNCKAVYKAKMANEGELTVLASPGFHLDGPAILKDCNRILGVIDALSPRKFEKGLRLYYAHFEPNTGLYSWRLPVIDSVGFVFVIDDEPKKEKFPTFGSEQDKGWQETSGECALAAEMAHELTHVVVPVFYLTPTGAVHGETTTGWFAEGLAEYACYLVWNDAPPCPWTRIDADFALRAFLNPSRRKHLWHWQSGVDGDWRPPKGTPPSEIWPGPDNPCRETFLSTDYTTAFGAFLYLEARLGRERLQAICRQLTSDHTWQSGAFYKDLEKAVGFDIRELSDKEILEILNRPKHAAQDKVVNN